MRHHIDAKGLADMIRTASEDAQHSGKPDTAQKLSLLHSLVKRALVNHHKELDRMETMLNRILKGAA